MPDDLLRGSIENGAVDSSQWTLAGGTFPAESDEGQRRIGDFLDTHSRAGYSWPQVANRFKEAFPEVNPESAQAAYEKAPHLRKLADIKGIYERAPEETDWEALKRKSIPIFSQVRQAKGRAMYGEAMQRFNANNPTDEDLHTIAAKEEQDRRLGKVTESLGGKLGEAALGLPAMLGEFAIGGQIVGGAGAALSTGLRGASVSVPRIVAAKVAGGLAQTAATTAVVPSMYVEKWVDDNVKEGRPALDPRGFPKAFGLGMVQTAILGSLQPIAGKVLPQAGAAAFAGRQAAKGGIGVAESAAADVLGKWAGLADTYGSAQDFIDGKYGEGSQKAFVQALTFAAFGTIHEAQHGTPTQQRIAAAPDVTHAPIYGTQQGQEPPPVVPPEVQHMPIYGTQQGQEPPQPVLSAFGTAWKKLQEKGLSANTAGYKLQALATRLFNAIDKNPTLTRPEAVELFKDEKEGPGRDYALSLVKAANLHEGAPEAPAASIREIPNTPEEAPPAAPQPQAAQTLAPPAPGPLKPFQERFPAGTHVDYQPVGASTPWAKRGVGKVVGYKKDPVTGDTFAKVENKNGAIEYVGDTNDIRPVAAQTPTPAPQVAPAAKPEPAQTALDAVPVEDLREIAEGLGYGKRFAGLKRETILKKLIADQGEATVQALAEAHQAPPKLPEAKPESGPGEIKSDLDETTHAQGIGKEVQEVSAEKAKKRPGIIELGTKALHEEFAEERQHDLLDLDMEGMTPEKLSNRFFAEVYPHLDPEAQKGVHDHIKQQTGFKGPGAWIATDKEGKKVYANSWEELSPLGEYGSFEDMLGAGGSNKPARMLAMYMAHELRLRGFPELFGSPQSPVADVKPVRQALGMKQPATEAQSKEALAELDRAAKSGKRVQLTELFDAAGVTPREQEVALRMAKGESFRQIGEAMGFSQETARLDAERLAKKVGLEEKSVFEALAEHFGGAETSPADAGPLEGASFSGEQSLDPTIRKKVKKTKERLTGTEKLQKELQELTNKFMRESSRGNLSAKRDAHFASETARLAAAIEEAQRLEDDPANQIGTGERGRGVEAPLRPASGQDVQDRPAPAGPAAAVEAPQEPPAPHDEAAAAPGREREAPGDKLRPDDATSFVQSYGTLEAWSPEDKASFPARLAALPLGELKDAMRQMGYTVSRKSTEAELRQQLKDAFAKRIAGGEAPSDKLTPIPTSTDLAHYSEYSAHELLEQLSDFGALSERGKRTARAELQTFLENFKEGEPLQEVVKRFGTDKELDGDIGKLEAFIKKAAPLIEQYHQEQHDIVHGEPKAIPPAILDKAKEFVAQNRRLELGDLVEALKEKFDPDVVKEFVKAAGKIPKEARDPGRKWEGRGINQQMRGGNRKHAARGFVEQQLSGKAGEPAGMGDAREEGAAGPPTEVAPGVLFGPPTTGATPGQGGKSISPYEVMATIRALFNLPTYGGGRDALYDLNNESTTIPKPRAADAPVLTHELAHHLAKTFVLPLDPFQLPSDVRKGFEQFDYVKNRQNRWEAMQEGFAEWLRRRSTDQLYGLTPEMKAAAYYSEKILEWQNVREEKGLLISTEPRNAGLTEKLDRIKGLFEKLQALDPVQRYAGTISQTNAPAQAILTPGEKAKGYLPKAAQQTADNLLDDALPAKRAEAAALSKGAKFKPGEKLSEVVATTRLRSIPDQNEILQGGMFGRDAQGKQTQLGRPVAEILKDIPAEDLKDLEVLMHARSDIHDNDVRKIPVPQEVVRQAREALLHLSRDLARFNRLTTAADGLTHEFFNASLRAMTSPGVGWKKPAWADTMIQNDPYYIPKSKIPELEWQQPSGDFMKARTGGSAEQRIGLMDAIQERALFTAHILNKQARDAALLGLSTKEGVGPWLNPGVEMQHLPSGREPIGWPADGAKPSVIVFKDGVPIRIRIQDKALYELITGTQGKDKSTVTGKVAGFIEGLGNIMAMTRIPQTVRTFGTVLSEAWLIKNLFRDPIQAAQRTVMDGNTISTLGDLFKWYGKAVSFYSRALWHGGAEHVEANQASDWMFKLQERMTGREMSVGAASGERTFSSRVMDGWHGFFQRVLDALTFAEKGTRVWELKNKWEKLGITPEWIDAEMKKDPSQRNPVPYALQVAGLDIASQITHNVHQQGIWIRQLNRSVPFLGAHIAGVYKDITNAIQQPKKVAGALAILAGAKTLEWLINKDDQDWKQLPDHYRFGFSFKTPMGWMHIPAPRGLSGVMTGIWDNIVRGMSDSNPRYAGLAAQAVEEVAPHGGPLAVPLQVAGNRTWAGRPIVPEKEAQHLGILQRFLTPEAGKYMAGQLSGGLTTGRSFAANPFGMQQHPHQTVTDFWDAFHAAEAAEAKAKSKGLRLQGDDLARVNRLKYAAPILTKLGKQLKDAPDERQAAIVAQQIDIARRAMGK